MDLPQHIRISGTFVIFQGVYGDGIRNTIDYIEPLVSMYAADADDENDDGDESNVSDTNNNNIASVIATTIVANNGSSIANNGTSISHHEVPLQIPDDNTTVSVDDQQVSSSDSRASVTPPPNEPLELFQEEGEHGFSSRDADVTNDLLSDDTNHQQAMNEKDHSISQRWERECRTIELYQRKEWYENAISQTTTTTIYSSNSRTEKSRYANILNPQHCIAYTGNSNDDAMSDDNTLRPSIPWWMSAETGCVAVLDQIPNPPIRIIRTLSHIFGVGGYSPEMLIPSQDGHVIGSLSPGTIVVATELLTLYSGNGTNPDIPVFTPLEIVPIKEDDNVDDNDDEEPCSDEHDDTSSTMNDVVKSGTTKIYEPGRLGWIQLLKIVSPICGYCVLSIDGYSFAGPGLPHHYIPGGHIIPKDDCDPNATDKSNGAMNCTTHPSTTLNGWYWRVMCIEGAYVRDGMDLTAHHVATIPYGSLVHVLRKSINAMGLSRLQIETIYYPAVSGSNNNQNNHPQYITGWISEFLNPLSGQRGPIVLPLPFPVPASYEVSLPEGAVIRSDVELSSPVIGHAPFGTIVSVIGCTYTEQPKDQCVARYRLAGNGGYINVKLNVPTPNDFPVVRFLDIDNKFHPNDPKVFHCHSVQRTIAPHRLDVVNDVVVNDTNNITTQQQQQSLLSPIVAQPQPQCIYTVPSHARIVGANNRTTQQQRRLLQQLRSYDDNDNDECIVDQDNNEIDDTNVEFQTKRSNSSNHKPLLCVICLCDERTATIIHGETGHIACCLLCARICKARGDGCPVCRLPIESVIQHFWA